MSTHPRLSTKKLGDMNCFYKKLQREDAEEAVEWLKARTLEARENDLDEASRNELQAQSGDA